MTTEAPKKEDKALAGKRKTLQELLNDEGTTANFVSMLGKDARSFQQNILTVYNGSKGLQACDPESIIAACGISASINLSILPSLGQSCIVPYKDGDRLVATWQIMWKGIIQLAHRSGQYRRINLAHVYEGQLVKHDEHKGIVTLRPEKRSDRVEGYYFWFELNSGTSMEFYWSAKKCVEHGLRYSQSFQKGGGKWTEDEEFTKAKTVKAWLAGKAHFLTEGSGADAMSAKTIVKVCLNKWGPLETRIKEIVALDQAAIGSDGKPTYIDVRPEDVERETKTYTAPPMAPKGSEPPAGDQIAHFRADAVKKGVDVERFNAWVLKQTGDQDAVAAATKVEWQRLAKKEVTAAEAFAVEAPADKGPKEKTVAFHVGGVSDSEFNGDPATCIRSTDEPAVKYYTTDEAVIKAAKAAQKAGEELSVKALEKQSGKHTFGWLTQLA